MVIGFAGPARSGKSTAAGVFSRWLPMPHCTMSFAEPLKDMLRYGLGLSESQLNGGKKDVIDARYGVTPRHLMQTLGTEWGRRLIGPSLWVDAMASRISKDTLIPDVRFEDEARFVRSRGFLVHILGRTEGAIDSDHVSEQGVPVEVGDIIIRNDSDIDTLSLKASEAVSEILHRMYRG